MYSNSQQSRCWNSYNVAWPCQPELGGDQNVLTLPIAVLGILGIMLSDPHSTIPDPWTSYTCTYSRERETLPAFEILNVMKGCIIFW